MPAPPQGPASLLASLPAYLHRQPYGSEVVLVGWSPADTDYSVLVTLSGRTEVSDAREEYEAIRNLVVDGAETFVAVAYSSRTSEPWALTALRFLGAAAARHGLDMLDAVLVVDGYWRSITCTDPACCPPAGTPLPTPTEETL